MIYSVNVNLVFEANTQQTLVLPILSNQMLKGFESGKLIGMMLLGVQKAFAALDHDILPDKMKSLGFTSTTIDWFGEEQKRNIVVSLEKTHSEI